MRKKQTGFSLIEVVLVLGIAALIFAMAFIALPSLWASQRDAQRKANVMSFISDLKTYQTNNSRGALPTSTHPNYDFALSDARNTPETDTWKAFIKDYVPKAFADPDMDEKGTNFRFYIYDCTNVSVSATCNTSSENTDFQPAYNRNKLGLHVFVSATCDGDHAVRANNNRSVAVIQVLERSGRYCYNT